MFYLKAGFHMIADDRRPYCDLRSAIRDRMETSLYKEDSRIMLTTKCTINADYTTRYKIHGNENNNS